MKKIKKWFKSLNSSMFVLISIMSLIGAFANNNVVDLNSWLGVQCVGIPLAIISAIVFRD
jgi:hypothetical protein